MKSEDRHKMQRNELADWLAKSIEQAKPFSKLISLVVILILLLWAATIWWSRQATGRDAVVWAEYDRAVASGDPKNLEEIVDLHPDSEVAHWAALAAGDAYLGRGCQELFANKSTASAALQDAVNHYRSVQEGARKPALLQRASFGLARAYEALAGVQGDLDKAIAAYREVVDKWPDGAYGEMAAERLEDLGREETEAFYDKFAKFDPQPATPDTPGAGSAGDGLPFDINSLLKENALSESPGAETTEEIDTEAGQPPPEDGPSMPEDSEAADSAQPDDAAQPEAAPPGGQTTDPSAAQPPPAADPPADPAPSTESSEPSP